MHKPQFLIGAASSGSGKTTFTLGLLRALKRRGYQVQPFKCGPDYLDPKHHTAAAGRVSVNLDSFMASSSHLQEIYSNYGKDADVCITEGVMGLFDGYEKSKGSSAEIAEILNLPVVLVVNAASTAYSVAALLYGYKHFYPQLHLVGAVFNFVSSASHYAYLQQACKDAGVEPLGYLKKSQEVMIPSRHLGLNIDQEFCFEDFADQAADLVEETVEVRRILEVCSVPFKAIPAVPFKAIPAVPFRIAVAQDEAFNFVYPQNLKVLESLGTVQFFSPLRDTVLPPTDFLYLPGGYPELYLPALSKNQKLREAISGYCKNGGKALAECGGMMYLGKYIADAEGKIYPMCDYLPIGSTMENMRLKLGYRKVLLYGQEYRGHEFHYSRTLREEGMQPSAATVWNARGTAVDTPVYRCGNVLASYVHFYWGEGQIPCLMSLPVMPGN